MADAITEITDEFTARLADQRLAIEEVVAERDAVADIRERLPEVDLVARRRDGSYLAFVVAGRGAWLHRLPVTKTLVTGEDRWEHWTLYGDLRSPLRHLWQSDAWDDDLHPHAPRVDTLTGPEQQQAIEDTRDAFDRLVDERFEDTVELAWVVLGKRGAHLNAVGIRPGATRDVDKVVGERAWWHRTSGGRVEVRTSHGYTTDTPHRKDIPDFGEAGEHILNEAVVKRLAAMAVESRERAEAERRRHSKFMRLIDVAFDFVEQARAKIITDDFFAQGYCREHLDTHLKAADTEPTEPEREAARSVLGSVLDSEREPDMPQLLADIDYDLDALIAASDAYDDEQDAR